MNVLQNLVGLYNHLPFDSTYRKVCGGILKNLKAAAEATIYDIAEMTDSSRTTVWRMVQKMGYQNFTDFHHDLKKAVQQYSYYNRILPAECAGDEDEIRNAFLKQTLTAQEIMKQYLKSEDLSEIARILYEADSVSIYVPYQSAAVFSLQQNLAMSGKETNYLSMIPDMLEESKSLTGKSVVFISIIEHAETMNMGALFEQIKKSGAQSFMVSASKSRYKKYVTRVLLEEAGKQDVAAEMIVFDMCFYMLSEIYRLHYLTE